MINDTVKGVERNIPGMPQIAPQKARLSKTTTGSMFKPSRCIRGNRMLPTPNRIA